MGKRFDFHEKVKALDRGQILLTTKRWQLWMQKIVRHSRTAKMVDARDVISSTYVRLLEEDLASPPAEDYDLDERFRKAAMTVFRSRCRQNRREVGRETSEDVLLFMEGAISEGLPDLLPRDFQKIYPVVRAQLDEITRRYGDLFLEALALGLSTINIAEMLGVASHDIYSARQKLSRRLRLELQEIANDR
ncbi:hypothetical protein OLZ32_22095 [Rhizobium sp. 1AS11]|uniref:hypothetical protein n=1 Tax=Rhizobium acaciae TaxID=2989736 RepID=UPI0022215DE3|nr:hypothetical protein [Rhizobium acaciae]MCW1411074.1 hypothetical protein [Rhizobium acaciae]MCW1743074.1 hypothetical protein [Rhizobium acaciae]